jgi:hypothetical protein
VGEWIARVFGGASLDPSSPAVRFEFAHAPAGWHWALIVAAAVALGWWSYARLEGSRVVRALTGIVRTAVLLLLVVLLCGPRLIEVKENVERDWVLVLVDRSASMGIADAPEATGAGLRTREAQLRAVLDKASPVFTEMTAKRTVKWLGFDGGAYDLPTGTGGMPLLENPTGRRTDLAAAIEGALAKGAARPVAGIVVLSDGRSASGAGGLPRALVKRLSSEKVPVVVVPLGSSEGLMDVAVGGVEAPPAAFVHDPVPVRTTVTRTGARTPGPATVRLVDKTGGEVLDEQKIEWAEGETSKQVTLTGRAGAGDRASWEVRIEPEGGAKDLIEGNNIAEVGISLVDRPLRLLYVDGYPRWEYRFLKNIFSRDESVKFSALLLSAGRKYLQEGSEEIDALPDSPGGWDAFDVIMIGDVQPGVLSGAQLEQIRNRVAVGGAGLLWVAGASAVPGAYRGTPLADLLPVVTGGGSGESVAVWDRDVVLRPAPAAEALGVLRLADRQADGSFWPKQVSDPAAGWSRLRWVQRLEPATLKPAAEALAMGVPVEGTGAATPAVVTMRFGAGRVIYVATDEIWRYRYGRGEDLPERFYMQLIRLLGRESVARAGKPAVLTLTPKDAEVGTAVRVGVELIDQALLDVKPAGLTVRMTKATAGTGEPERVEVSLKPTGDAGGGRARAFVGTWVPPSAGTWNGVVTDALLEGKGVTAVAEVAIPDDELRRPEADHPLLASLAQETGGAVLSEGTIEKLASVLPKREVRTMSIARQETLWDRPGVLAVLIGLLGVEWVLRRVIRLI